MSRLNARAELRREVPTTVLDATDAIEPQSYAKLDQVIEDILLKTPVKSREDRRQIREEFEDLRESGAQASRTRTDQAIAPVKIKQANVFFPKAIEEVGFAAREIVDAVGENEQVIFFVENQVVVKAINTLVYGLPGAENVHFVYTRGQTRNLLLQLEVTRAYFFGSKGTSDDQSIDLLSESLENQEIDLVINRFASPSQIARAFRISDFLSISNWKRTFVLAKSA